MSGRILNGRRVLSEVTRSLVEEREKHRISVSPNLGEHPWRNSALCRDPTTSRILIAALLETWVYRLSRKSRSYEVMKGAQPKIIPLPQQRKWTMIYVNTAKSGALDEDLELPSGVRSEISQYRYYNHNTGNSTASLSSTSINCHFPTSASMSHDALKHISTAIIFAPVAPLLLGYLIPSSCYLWIVREETLQTLWKLLAILSLVFRASAGSESLRVMFHHSNSRLFYSLSLGYMLPWLLMDTIPGPALWLCSAAVTFGTWFGTHVVSTAGRPSAETGLPRT